jgi:hypothetical protein
VKIASEGSKYPRKAPPQRIDRRRDRVLHLVSSVPRYVAAKDHGINRHFAIKKFILAAFHGRWPPSMTAIPQQSVNAGRKIVDSSPLDRVPLIA